MKRTRLTHYARRVLRPALSIALASAACFEVKIRDPGLGGGGEGGAGGAGADGAGAGGAGIASNAAGGDSGTSRAGGDGGDNAAGGDGGDGAADAGGPPACMLDAECGDEEPCNGVETCASGQCQPGASECGGFDVANCDCVTGTDGCEVRAADRDQDQHGSILCSAVPGDDCDDMRDFVYPGAAEQCNGLDDDCDGLLDLDDGFALGGAPVELWTATTDTEVVGLHWFEMTGIYGLAYDVAACCGPGDLGVYFLRMSSTGLPIAAPVRVTPEGQMVQSAALGVSNTDFALVWFMGGSLWFQRIGAGGELIGAALELMRDVSTATAAAGLDLHWTGGGWVLAYQNDQGLVAAQRLAHSGLPQGFEVVLSTTNAGHPRIAVGSGLVGIIWAATGTQPGYWNQPEWSRRDLELNDLGGFELGGADEALSEIGAQIASNGVSFAFTWRFSDRALFWLADTAGSALCPADLDLGPTTISGLVAYYAGYLIVGDRALGMSNATHQMVLSRVGNDCSHYGDWLSLSSQDAGAFYSWPKIAVGSQGIATVWADGRKLWRRMLPKYLCDVP